MKTTKYTMCEKKLTIKIEVCNISKYKNILTTNIIHCKK